jgi:ubiquinone/menaquinone biosynthesis C-methylase UbiE
VEEKMANPHVCSAEHARFLDTALRKLVHNPIKILKPYIQSGMKVADIGCGPGFFTIPIAQLVGDKGSVYAYDLQSEMLDKVSLKIRKNRLEPRVSVHLCETERINFVTEVDCVLGFFMVHEVPDIQALMREVYATLVPGGIFIVVEPIFHVSTKQFRRICDQAEKEGFSLAKGPRVLFGRSAVLKK